MHFPKIEFAEIQPLILPRLFPICNRPPWIALPKWRSPLPFTLHSTIPPTAKLAGSTGSTVQSWPDSTLPRIELPRGRHRTASPLPRLALSWDAQPILLLLLVLGTTIGAFCPSEVFTQAATGNPQ